VILALHNRRAQGCHIGVAPNDFLLDLRHLRGRVAARPHWLSGVEFYHLTVIGIGTESVFNGADILASQTRADRLANLREQMTLETVLLNTQKASKLIDLMEELRRDSPNVKDRVDLEAMEMAGLPDYDTVLNAIQEINENLPAEG
jgi:hypothetical protein